MENKISPFIASQITAYLQESAPLFVAFLETYYQYIQKRTNAVGLVINRSADADIDTTLDVYVSEFYSTYGEYLPNDIAMDRRNLIKLLNSVYEAKGTEKALKLIFQSLFNETITVSYPSDQILRSSDGLWESESFITLVTQFGNIPSGNVTISVTNLSGDYSIETSKIEVIGQDIARFYFKTFNKIAFYDAQLVFVYINGVVVYVGKLTPSPTKLIIKSPGTSWQKGQVVIIPGTTKNTVAQVTSTNSSGGMVGAEILEYGYVHSANQTTIISPYAHKPSGSDNVSTSTLVSINPSVYQHTINISDYTDGTTDDIIGVTDGFSQNSYFLENYSAYGYVGEVVISQSTTNGYVLSPAQDTGFTISQWLNSRTSLTYEMSNVVKTKGFYKNDQGQLSNQEIKLQDNYFYQAFSYLVETTKDIREYKNILNITHPAGTKMFSNLEKIATYDLSFDSERTISYDEKYLLDVATASVDSLALTFVKYISDSISVSDTNSISFVKYINDSVSATSSDVSVLTLQTYTLDNYFSQAYFENSYQLQIG